MLDELNCQFSALKYSEIFPATKEESTPENTICTKYKTINSNTIKITGTSLGMLRPYALRVSFFVAANRRIKLNILATIKMALPMLTTVCPSMNNGNRQHKIITIVVTRNVIMKAFGNAGRSGSSFFIRSWPTITPDAGRNIQATGKIPVLLPLWNTNHINIPKITGIPILIPQKLIACFLLILTDDSFINCFPSDGLFHF